MIRILKSKKGISPILATLLLIVIAVAAVIVTYAWVITFTGTTTENAGALLQPENIRFHSGDSIEIVIRNSGTGNAKIVEVYQGPSTAELQKITPESYEPSTQLVNPGESITINLELSSDWTSGTTYYFQVVTEQGYKLPFQKVAP